MKSIKLKDANYTKKKGELGEEAFVLWKQVSKTGVDYLTGYIVEDGKRGQGIVGFFNGNKKNPKEPDIRIYLTADELAKEEVCSLWEHISINEKRYLTGSTDEKEDITAFYNNSDVETRPYIRAYYTK